jgi:hypothetical protein
VGTASLAVARRALDIHRSEASGVTGLGNSLPEPVPDSDRFVVVQLGKHPLDAVVLVLEPPKGALS